jgi:hypothetical protein
MLTLSAPSRLFLSSLAMAVLVCVLAQPPAARAWGNGGHRLVNKLAASSLPADVPAFLRSPEAINEIEYLGPEPDRWRSPAEPELVAAQAPEHFIDLEQADALGPLPHRRLDFEARVFAAGERPEKIGLQPWEATEVWERLKAALREYRNLTARHENTRPVEQAILFYAGWLGHYVGDGSQPLHTSIQYNGWVGLNPHGYTTGHQIHWQFEGPFVDANLREPEVRAAQGHHRRHLRCVRGLSARIHDLCGKGLSTGESRRVCGRGIGGVAGVYRRAAGGRGQHVARYDLYRMAGERQACARSLRGKVRGAQIF